MTRHSGESSYQRGAKAVAEHVLHVFPQSEAQGDEHRVDDGIEPAVEVGGVPGARAEQQVFESFFGQSHDEVHDDHIVDEGSFLEQRSADPHAYTFRYDGKRCSDNAFQYQAEQHAGRFGFEPVVFIDLEQEDEGGDDGRRHQDRKGIEQ